MPEFIIYLSIALVMYAVGYISGRKRRIKNIDYKERWLIATNLLNDREFVKKEGLEPESAEKPLVRKKIERVETRDDHKRMMSQARKDLETLREMLGIPPYSGGSESGMKVGEE